MPKFKLTDSQMNDLMLFMVTTLKTNERILSFHVLLGEVNYPLHPQKFTYRTKRRYNALNICYYADPTTVNYLNFDNKELLNLIYSLLRHNCEVELRLAQRANDNNRIKIANKRLVNFLKT